MLHKYHMYYCSLWWYERSKIDKGYTIIVSIFMYDDDYN